MGVCIITFRRCDDSIDCFESDFHFDVFRKYLVLNQDLQDFLALGLSLDGARSSSCLNQDLQDL